MHRKHRHLVNMRLISTLLAGIGLLLSSASTRAGEVEHRLGQGVPLAVGIGAEVSHGDYDADADATVTTVPVLVLVNPVEDVDVTVELPLVHLRSRADSGVVVTGSGGGGGMQTPSHGRGSHSGPERPMDRPPVMTPPPAGSSSDKVTETGLGDISLQVGWTVLHDDGEHPKLRPTFSLKVPSGDDERGLGTGTFEGGPGLFVSRWLGDWQLFAEGAYLLQDSTDDYQGKNYVNYGAGAGVQANDRLFVSLYAKGSSARVEGGEAAGEGWLKLNFLQSRRLSWEAYVLAGFTEASPDVGGGLLLFYQY